MLPIDFILFARNIFIEKEKIKGKIYKRLNEKVENKNI